MNILQPWELSEEEIKPFVFNSTEAYGDVTVGQTDVDIGGLCHAAQKKLLEYLQVNESLLDSNKRLMRLFLHFGLSGGK